MTGKVNLRFGEASFQFEFEGQDEMEVMHRAIVLGNAPRRCSVCGGTDLRLDSGKYQDKVYTNVVCACQAKARLCQVKGGGYFWKPFEKYQRNQRVEQPRSQKQQVSVPSDGMESW